MRCEYGLLLLLFAVESGLGLLCAGIGECEFAYDDCARMSSTASSAKSCVECTSISALEGSMRKSVGCSVDLKTCAYCLNRERRSSPPQLLIGLGTCDGPSVGGGGYAVTLDLDECGDWSVNECDSSSWKWSVGRVSPLMRFMAMDPSVEWNEESE